jgi:hypothetical protein
LDWLLAAQHFQFAANLIGGTRAPIIQSKPDCANSLIAMAAKAMTPLSANTVTGTVQAGLRRRRHSGKVVAVS